MRFSFFILFLFSLVNVHSVERTTKPNFIYILADDLGYSDIGSYGGKIIKTPELDALRDEGMKFTQHYSGSTVCAPTRCVLMTGKHTGHATIRGNGGPNLNPEDVTIAELLKTKGYRTGIIGKWGLGEAGSEGVPNKQGFDFWYGYLNQRNAHHYYPPFLWRNQEKEMFPDNPENRDHYSHDLFTGEAIRFIQENKEQPFFLYLAYTIPHVDLDVPDDSSQPYLETIKEDKVYGKPGGQHYRYSKTPRATFAGMVSRLDRDVGKIKKFVDALGIGEETLIIFSSDNGPTSAGGADPDFFDGNGPFRGIKRDLFEGGIRVPMIARWKGHIKPGTTTDHISAHWDVLATLCSLAGMDKQSLPQQDGISFAPTLLNSGSQKSHEYLYWEFYEQGGKQAIRYQDWKGVRLQLNNNPKAPIHLFNLAQDPAESQDVASDNPEMIRKLNALLRTARTDSKHYQWKPRRRR